MQQYRCAGIEITVIMHRNDGFPAVVIEAAGDGVSVEELPQVKSKQKGDSLRRRTGRYAFRVNRIIFLPG